MTQLNQGNGEVATVKTLATHTQEIGANETLEIHHTKQILRYHYSIAQRYPFPTLACFSCMHVDCNLTSLHPCFYLTYDGIAHFNKKCLCHSFFISLQPDRLDDYLAECVCHECNCFCDCIFDHVPKPRLVGIEPNPGPKGISDVGLKHLDVVHAGNRPDVRHGRTKRRSHNLPDTAVMDAQFMSTAGMTEQTTIKTGFYPISATANSSVVRITFAVSNLSFSGLAYTGDNIYVPGQVATARSIDKNLFIGTSVEKYFDNFERWRCRSMSLDFVTAVGTTTAGNMYVFCDPDPKDSYVYGTTVSQMLIDSHQAEAFPVYKTRASIPVKHQSRMLYTDVDEVETVKYPLSSIANTAYSAPNSDVRLDSAGTIVVAVGLNVSTTVLKVGTLFITTVLEFHGPQTNELSTHVCTLRAITPVGSSITSATAVTTATFSGNPFNTVLSGQNNIGVGGQLEYSYNPLFVNNVATTAAAGPYWLYLPVGEYMAFTILTHSNSNSPSGGQFSTAALYAPQYTAISNYSIAALDQNELGTLPYYEFVAAPTNPAVAVNYVNVLCLWRFRVTSLPPSSALTPVNLYYTYTLNFGSSTNTNLIGALFECRRLGDVSSNPVAQLFPDGNATNLALDVKVNRLTELLKLTEDEKEKALVQKELDAAKNSQKRVEIALRKESLWNLVMPRVVVTETKEPESPGWCDDALSRSVHIPQGTSVSSLVSALSSLKTHK